MPNRLLGLIEDWQGNGVVVRFDRPSGCWMFVALHDATLGQPSGGTRLSVYPGPEEALTDALRLAEGMTYKWAALGMPIGGGKAVISAPEIPRGEERKALFRRYGDFLDSLHGAFTTGVDLGTTPEDMALVGTRTRWVHGLTDDGSPVDPGPFTARGVFAGIRVALAHKFGSDELTGRRVLVQGLGDVGGVLCRLLAGGGARLLLCDLDGELASSLAAELGGEVVEPEAIYDIPCDVYSPCAVGATLNQKTIPRLACSIVAGSANNQLGEEADAERLHERGILYAPDYIINGGGAKAFGLWSQGLRWEEELFRRVEEIGEALEAIFREAAERDEPPSLATRRMVDRILEKRPA